MSIAGEKTKKWSKCQECVNFTLKFRLRLTTPWERCKRSNIPWFERLYMSWKTTRNYRQTWISNINCSGLQVSLLCSFRGCLKADRSHRPKDSSGDHHFGYGLVSERNKIVVAYMFYYILKYLNHFFFSRFWSGLHQLRVMRLDPILYCSCWTPFRDSSYNLTAIPGRGRGVGLQNQNQKSEWVFRQSNFTR